MSPGKLPESPWNHGPDPAHATGSWPLIVSTCPCFPWAHTRAHRKSSRAASHAAAAVAASIAPFKVNFDRAGSFAGGRDPGPFVLRASGDNSALMHFHRRLGAKLGKRGFPCDQNARLTWHVSLLRRKPGAAGESGSEVSWTVNEFVLVHSLPGKAPYNPLARWTLQGRAGGVDTGCPGTVPVLA